MLEVLDQWCHRWLTSAISEVLFQTGYLSEVVGVKLADGREIAIKVREKSARLYAAYLVQQQVWLSGYPAPEPLVPPSPFGEGKCATAERLVPGGDVGGRRPGDAKRFAEALAWLLRVTPPPSAVRGDLAPSPPWVAWDHTEAGLWPTPDDRTEDLNLLPEPEWLDEVARRCQERLSRYSVPRVIGHGDWYAGNMRWSGNRLLVVHDWDSVVCQPEAVIVGMAAAVYPASGPPWQPATIDESQEFLSAYARAKSEVWTSIDIQACWAAGVWVRAFDAKKESVEGVISNLSEDEASGRLSRAAA
jgi:hypothetical protein